MEKFCGPLVIAGFLDADGQTGFRTTSLRNALSVMHARRGAIAKFHAARSRKTAAFDSRCMFLHFLGLR